MSFAVVLLSFCRNESKNNSVEAHSLVDTLKALPAPKGATVLYLVVGGTIEWSGIYTLSKDGHHGTINIEGGKLLLNDDRLVSGKINIDINTVSVNDIKDPGEKRDLESHLKDADFFDAKPYPKAVFEFREAFPGATTTAFNWVLNGFLTMKGQTHPVVVPVKMTLAEGWLQAETPGFSINRTQWGG